MLLREEVLDIIDATRDICENLYPPMIERLGLYMSLNTLFEKYKVRYNFLIKDDIEEIDGLSLDQATAIYRIIQELLTNASKHSEAYVIHIVLKKQNHTIYIEYIDDGVGIDKNISLDEIKSLGLIGIQERVNHWT